MNFPLFVARRIYSNQISDRQKVSKPAIRIATMGVAIVKDYDPENTSGSGYNYPLNKVINFGVNLTF